MTQFKLLLSIIILFTLNLPASSSDDLKQLDRLTNFLDTHNRSEAILIKQLVIHQNKQALLVYDHIDNEEKQKQLQERPILKQVAPTGPFVKNNAFTLLVDRDQPLALDMDIKAFYRAHKKVSSTLIKEIEIKRLIYWLKPSDKQDEERYILLKNNHFELLLSDITFIGKIVIEIRRSDTRHQVVLTLINKAKPVTIKD